MEEKNESHKKKIEIVQGNPKDLNISDVKDNLVFEEHKNDTKKKGEIVIPKTKK